MYHPKTNYSQFYVRKKKELDTSVVDQFPTLESSYKVKAKTTNHWSEKVGKSQGPKKTQR